MTERKKIVYGGKRGYDRAIERHKAKGWRVESETHLPATRKRVIYIANLTR